MDIDYSCTQLPEDELADLLQRRRRDAAEDEIKERERMAKVRRFHFAGGMV